MANDCWNRVTITGDSDTLKKLYNKFDGHSTLRYSNYHEMFDTDVSDMVGDDWGPKWFTPSADWDGEKLIVTGDSAWVPAVPFFEMISAEYSVTCDVWYDERGMDFAGHMVMVDGEVEESQEWTYWEYLYLNDREQFNEEVYECGGWCETFDEVKDNLALDKWNDSSMVDLAVVETLFEKYQEDNR